MNDFVPLSLDAHYNLDAVSTREAPDPGKMDGQFSLPFEGLPGKQTAWIEKIPFDLSLVEPGRKNCLVPNGNRISVEPGDYGAVYFLGTSVTGSSAAEVIFTFETGGRRRELVERLRFTDWSHPPQFGERQAVSFPFRWGECGEVLWPCALWLQAIVLPQTAERLVSIAFDHCPAMRIFAMTLGSNAPALPDESMLEYLLARLGPKDREAARFDTLYHALNDLRALKNDEQLRAQLAEIRSRVLAEIGFDALFSGCEKRVTDCLRKCNKILDERHASETALLAGQEPASPLDITLVGHSHLDAVWLWPRNVSVRKAFNTFSRNLKRLERFQDVVFAQSSPQFYEWMEADFPDVFKAIQQQVKAGRWELVGGMWIEPDGNMPCGEALVRQRVFGQRYFLEKFGRLSEVAWIPDTFGMHKNHPQIIAKTGGKYFYTTKLMWNYENRFPYQHFIWESPDGSRVLALQSAVGCGEQPGPHQDLEASVKKHNMLLAPGQEVRADYGAPYPPEDALSEEFIPEVLAIYGEGDGGEGPSDRCYHRAQNLAHLPNYRNGTVHSHFQRIEKKYGKRLPIWTDELYLENHRGTTTSQGRIKALNRQGEAAVLCAEKWATLRRVIDGTAAPKKALDRIWKKLLFNQFHDILPGTSIAQAYVDAEFDFDDVIRTSEGIRRHALRALAARISTLPLDDAGQPGRFLTGKALIVFNPLAWTRHEMVRIPWGFPNVKVLDLENRAIPSQVIFRDGRHWLCFRVEVPAFGYTQVRLVAGQAPVETGGHGDDVKVAGRVAESRYYRLELNERGNIDRLFDKRLKKELVSGEANMIRFFKNRPKEWSNWNLDPDYEKHELIPEGPVSIEVVDAGPVVGAFRITKPAAESGQVVQEIVLYRDSKRIDFITDLDVNYTESLVKAVFPLNTDASFMKTEIAYGTHDRPMKPRTDFEKAMWEVWTHKWLDLSGNDCGLTFLNSAKYGFDQKEKTIRLTLVKGGIMPDGRTDLYKHRIDYALVSHDGGFEKAHAWRRGYEYNFPVHALLEDEHDGSLPPARAFGGISPDNVCWEVFKPAEDDAGLVIRVYEVEGIDVDRVNLDLPFEVSRAEEVDFLEKTVINKVETQGNRVVFPLGRHEIKAIRVYQ